MTRAFEAAGVEFIPENGGGAAEGTADMTTTPETPLAMAERHVRVDEARVARQEALLAELLRDGHTGHTIEIGKALLETMRITLDLAREDLQRAREKASHGA